MVNSNTTLGRIAQIEKPSPPKPIRQKKKSQSLTDGRQNITTAKPMSKTLLITEIHLR